MLSKLRLPCIPLSSKRFYMYFFVHVLVMATELPGTCKSAISQAHGFQLGKKIIIRRKIFLLLLQNFAVKIPSAKSTLPNFYRNYGNPTNVQYMYM